MSTNSGDLESGVPRILSRAEAAEFWKAWSADTTNAEMLKRFKFDSYADMVATARAEGF